jgi:methyl acetate hydrolase
MAIPLIERLLDEADTNQAAAGVVALAADEGGVFYQGARGRIGPDVATPIALDSIFRIASMTKAITSTAAMQLVEDGKVDLDQAMRAIVPELGEVKVRRSIHNGGVGQRQPRSALDFLSSSPIATRVSLVE